MNTTQLQDEALSDRELEVLELIAHGHKDREAASILDIEECTVRFQIRKILGKLEAKNRAAAVYHAFKKGWIS